MPPRFEPMPCRAGIGPIHIGIDTARGWQTACGKRLRSGRRARLLDWLNGRRCEECDTIADHATDRQLLRLIAGW
jgi:hypothetical protein